jgi:hypothetical protein
MLSDIATTNGVEETAAVRIILPELPTASLHKQ